MFKRLGRKLQDKTVGRNAPPAPGYEGPIAKRIALLANIKDLATDLVHDCTEISKTFDYEDGPLHNVAECMAISLKLAGTACKGEDKESAEFLLKLNLIYDDIGKSQRKFQAALKEQVIDPLNVWLLTDYTRMHNEIQHLNNRKREMDAANERLNRHEIKQQDQINAEQTRKEFERQMDVVKAELLKLTAVKNEHADRLAKFLELQLTYHQETVEVMERNGITAA